MITGLEGYSRMAGHDVDEPKSTEIADPTSTTVGASHLKKPPERRNLVDRLSTVLTVAVHLACLGVFFVPVSSTVIVLAIVGYVVRMFGITAGYHRYFSHRSFRTGRVFQFVLAWLGTSAMQNGPLWWSSWHRRHHKHSDTLEDAHSPVHGGFYHAHIGWFLGGSHEQPDLSNVKDLERYPELRFLETFKWLPLVVYGAICVAVAGLPGLLWGFFLSTIVLLHATACINSLAHVWGSRRFDTKDESRNNGVLAFFTLGEGWHNNHHHQMASTRQGVMWWELDVTFYVLRLLSLFGVVWDLKTHASIAAGREARRLSSPIPSAPELGPPEVASAE